MRQPGIVGGAPYVWWCAIPVVLLFVAVAAAPWLSPYDPNGQDILARLKGPTAAHWMGTDNFGRDVLSRVLAGARLSLAVSMSAVAAALLAGGGVGILAAFYRGAVDRVAMRLMDVLFAFPVILLAIGIISVLGPGALGAAVAIAVVYTPIFARVIRAPALVVCASDYVVAARAVGGPDVWIMRRHVLPNLVSVILVQASLMLSTAILVEASLSFLGIGVQPPDPSLGRMLAEGRAFVLLSPWASVFSGLAILLSAFVFNLTGDVLRDALDPRLRA